MNAVLDAKLKATLTARACLIGCVLTSFEDDHGREVFVISRGALTKQLDTPEDVDAWLKRAGGPEA